MSGFEFFFSLFGLLLGFSLVEVLGGLARTVEARLRPGTTLRIGWLTPLLGIFVLLDLLTFWQAAWALREVVQVTGPTLVGGLLFAGTYYLAAHLVFPPDPEAAGDLDSHYFRVRRIVLGTLLALALLQILYFFSIPRFAAALGSPQVIAYIATLPVLMLAAIFTPGRRLNAAVLAVLSARYLFSLLF